MRVWWGALSLRARLALAFGAMAAAALIFLLAIVARTLGPQSLAQGKILPASFFALVVFFLGGWFVAEWCLREIGRLAAKARATPAMPVPAELEGLAALLRRETERHDRLLAELRRFTADAAHELRTPLTALRTTGEVALRNEADAQTLREALGTMLEESQRMSGLLERLLRLARLESETLVLEMRSLQLSEYLAEWREGLLVLAEEKALSLELECSSDLSIVADASLLGHAVTNLLYNAIRHGPTGSRVRIEARANDGSVFIAISDQGPGIAPAHHSRVFERFYRVDTSRARDAGGHGLGLCIAKTAVERLGGTISLQSSVGEGAVFAIRLPIIPQRTEI